jgi:hypothetical protein
LPQPWRGWEIDWIPKGLVMPRTRIGRFAPSECRLRRGVQYAAASRTITGIGGYWIAAFAGDDDVPE